MLLGLRRAELKRNGLLSALRAGLVLAGIVLLTAIIL